VDTLREGGRERGREGGKERKGEGGREGEKGGGREGGREGGGERARARESKRMSASPRSASVLADRARRGPISARYPPDKGLPLR
jgi:hypothetical protein